MRIRVQLLGDRGEVLWDASQDVTGELLRDPCRSLDFPAKGCDSIAATVCTPPRVRHDTELSRRQFASFLSSVVASEFLAFFSSGDTVMGKPWGRS